MKPGRTGVLISFLLHLSLVTLLPVFRDRPERPSVIEPVQLSAIEFTLAADSEPSVEVAVDPLPEPIPAASQPLAKARPPTVAERPDPEPEPQPDPEPKPPKQSIAKAPQAVPEVRQTATRAEPVAAGPVGTQRTGVSRPRPKPDGDLPPSRTNDYFAALLKAIEAHKVYPRRAQRLGIQGRVRVAFSLLADGRIADVRVGSSSGSSLLDRAAMEAVSAVGRFNAVSGDRERQHRELEVEIRFMLN